MLAKVAKPEKALIATRRQRQRDEAKNAESR